jgi:fucose permease
LVLAPDLRAASIGVVICGFCYGPIFPTTAGTASTYFPKIFGTVFGMLMVMAFTGSMVLPAAIGHVAKTATVRAGIWLILGSALLLTVAQVIFVRYERRRRLSSGA